MTVESKSHGITSFFFSSPHFSVTFCAFFLPELSLSKLELQNTFFLKKDQIREYLLKTSFYHTETLVIESGEQKVTAIISTPSGRISDLLHFPSLMNQLMLK